MTDDEVRRTEEPDDAEPLSVLAASMTADLPDGVRAIVLLQDGDRGMVHLAAYDEDVDAITDMLIHLRAIFRGTGRDLIVVPMHQSTN